ncbi:MAG: DNA mismatch repair endonuclease MutL [Treponema sp.]|nr:DNA mismatch repair endonuclease MutL [Treponema sp.]
MNIQILPPEEARRIAAGEVIDRPAALIREFLDNAIDAGASVIEVSIENGGVKKAEVSDDGSGMAYNDLEKCWLTHATSKIRSLDDLANAETLGFRGEALAAAAAVARLEIISSTGTGEAWRLEVGPGDANPPQLTACSRTKGSTVRACNLYETIPARKRFLKREGSEAVQCRQMFIEKALAFPWITFRFTSDGRPKDVLTTAASKKERFAAALLDAGEGNFLHEIHISGSGFSADVVFGGPELFHNDRRMLFVFANGRRIQDYSLMHALEHGTQGWFPNSTHPIGAVYLDIDPALADFNIHPAKREARFRDSGAIHHAITDGLRSFCRQHSLQAVQLPIHLLKDRGMEDIAELSPTPCSLFPDPSPIAAEAALHFAADAPPPYDEIRYAGRAFGLFILAERDNVLYLIDQHAAHERILYNRFLNEPIPKQELIIPIVFTTGSPEDDSFLERKREELASLAIVIARDGNSWRIDALPAGWRLGDTETVKEILDLRNAGENIGERWAATLCCHQAVRDGDYLDDKAALNLAKEALALPNPRCPHGRPIWTEITREALYRAVRRN